jgi:hypothetical protein
LGISYPEAVSQTVYRFYPGGEKLPYYGKTPIKKSLSTNMGGKE